MSDKLWHMIDELGVTKSNWSKIKEILDRYHLEYLADMDFNDFKDYHVSLASKETKYQVRTGSYSVYTPKRIGEIVEELGLEDKQKLYLGNSKREIKAKIKIGYTYIMLLHHFSDYNNKVTVSDKKDRNPLALGLGLTREDGQKLGEMESVALIIHGATDYLRSERGDKHNDWFLFNMLAAGFMLTDDKGDPLLSEFRNKKHKLLKKYK